MTRMTSATLVFATALLAGTANAGIIVNAVGIGQATGDVWARGSQPPAPPTHTLTVAGYLPSVFLGPNLGLCDPQTFVAITAISPTAFTYRYNQDGRAFGGDSIGADGAELAQYVHPVSSSCHVSIDVTEEVTPTSIHFVGEMILSDSGGAARIRLIDGADPLEPHIIYEDLFLNPNSTELNRMIDLTVPLPSRGAETLFIQLDTYGSSTPTPSALSLLGAAGLIATRRRR